MPAPSSRPRELAKHRARNECGVVVPGGTCARQKPCAEHAPRRPASYQGGNLCFLGAGEHGGYSLEADPFAKETSPYPKRSR